MNKVTGATEAHGVVIKLNRFAPHIRAQLLNSIKVIRGFNTFYPFQHLNTFL